MMLIKNSAQLLMKYAIKYQLILRIKKVLSVQSLSQRDQWLKRIVSQLVKEGHNESGEHLGGAAISEFSEFIRHCSSHLPAFSVGLYSVSPADT